LHAKKALLDDILLPLCTSARKEKLQEIPDMSEITTNKRLSLIDQLNEAICFQLCRRYYRWREQGRGDYVLLHPIFYPGYLFRIVYLLIKVLVGRSGSLHARWSFVLGLEHFRKPPYSPGYYSGISCGFPDAHSFRATVVFFAGNSAEDALAALRAIKWHMADDTACEVFLVGRRAPLTTGWKNVNAVESLDAAISAASADLILLIHQSVLIQAGLIDRMLEAYLSQKDAGIVFPKFIGSDGLLREAGSVVHTNGTIHRYGAYDDARRSEYNFLRETDCSVYGAMLFSKDDYLKAGGIQLNEWSEGPNAGIVDFCLKVRDGLRKEVYYQPRAVAVVMSPGQHNGGFTSDVGLSQRLRDVDRGIDKYFSKPAVTVIDGYVPRFDKESGSRRILELLRIMRSLNLRVRYIPHDCKYVEPYSSLLSDMGVETVYRYLSRRQRKKAIDKFGRRSDVLWICRPELAKRYQYLLKRYPRLKWVYDTVDLHYVRLSRALKVHPEDRALTKQLTYYRKLEPALAERADVTVCITKDEERELREMGVKNTTVIPNIHELQNQSDIPFEARRGLLFIGGYKHQPNEDAALWLCEQIMPLVWEKYPDIPVTLLGSDPTDRVLALRSSRIHIPGYVSDVSPYFNQARVFVAPLRYGAGMKGKVGQSLEYRLPVISTTIGAEGMSLVDGRHVLIADTEMAFAGKIVDLYRNAELWTAMHNVADEAIRPFTQVAIKERLKGILEHLMSDNR